MSVKNNAFLAAAAVALGINSAIGAPVVEAMLNNVPVSDLAAAEVDQSGKAVVFVTVDGAVRPVADNLGHVRLYTDGAAVIAMAKRTNLGAGAVVRFVRAPKVASVGDPVVTLKSRYKSTKKERDTAVAALTVIDGKKSAAESLGWNSAIGTPEHAEYQDIVQRQTVVTEWRDTMAALKTQLEAALVAAGVDPLTVV